MDNLQIGALGITGTQDPDGELEVRLGTDPYAAVEYINVDQAREIIDHLQEVFKLVEFRPEEATEGCYSSPLPIPAR